MRATFKQPESDLNKSDRGAPVLGRTQSGKPIYRANNEKMYGKVTGKKPEDDAVHVTASHDDFTADDHMDAAGIHNEKAWRCNEAIKDADHAGEDDGAEAMIRMQQNHRNASRAHQAAGWKMRDKEMRKNAPPLQRSIAGDDLAKSDTALPKGAIAKAMDGINDVMVAMISLPTVSVDLNPGGNGGCPIPPPLEMPAPKTGVPMPMRVDILAPTPMSTSERMAAAKAIQSLPLNKRPAELARSGLAFAGPRMVHLQKGAFSINEFADAVGTTEETVRMIARRCGDPDKFLQLIKSKLGDIQRAHGMSSEDAKDLYAAATRTVKSLTFENWSRWMSKSFGSAVPTDAGMAESIRINGFIDPNQLGPGGIAHQYHRVARVPPEPVNAQLENQPLGRV